MYIYKSAQTEQIKNKWSQCFLQTWTFLVVHRSERKDRQMAAGIHGEERCSLEHFNGSLMMCVRAERNRTKPVLVYADA